MRDGERGNERQRQNEVEKYIEAEMRRDNERQKKTDGDTEKEIMRD